MSCECKQLTVTVFTEKVQSNAPLTLAKRLALYTCSDCQRAQYLSSDKLQGLELVLVSSSTLSALCRLSGLAQRMPAYDNVPEFYLGQHNLRLGLLETITASNDPAMSPSQRVKDYVRDLQELAKKKLVPPIAGCIGEVSRDRRSISYYIAQDMLPNSCGRPADPVRYKKKLAGFVTKVFAFFEEKGIICCSLSPQTILYAAPSGARRRCWLSDWNIESYMYVTVAQPMIRLSNALSLLAMSLGYEKDPVCTSVAMEIVSNELKKATAQQAYLATTAFWYQNLCAAQTKPGSAQGVGLGTFEEITPCLAALKALWFLEETRLIKATFTQMLKKLETSREFWKCKLHSPIESALIDWFTMNRTSEAMIEIRLLRHLPENYQERDVAGFMTFIILLGVLKTKLKLPSQKRPPHAINAVPPAELDTSKRMRRSSSK